MNSREIPFALTNLLDHLTSYLGDYDRYFETETADGHELCRAYLAGLIKTEAGKRNMEHLNEEIDMAGDSYQRIQQFITDSPWSASAVITAMALNCSDLYANQPNLSGVNYLGRSATIILAGEPRCSLGDTD